MNPIPILEPDLVDEIVERVARRSAELVLQALDERDRDRRPPAGLVSAQELARQLGVSRAYVYDHAARLGAVTTGSGPKARLRFDVARAREALTARTACHADRDSNGQIPPAAGAPRRRRRTAARSDVELLPIAGGDR